MNLATNSEMKRSHSICIVVSRCLVIWDRKRKSKMGDFSGAYQAALRRVCSNPTPTVQSELYWMRVSKTVPYPFLAARVRGVSILRLTGSNFLLAKASRAAVWGLLWMTAQCSGVFPWSSVISTNAYSAVQRRPSHGCEQRGEARCYLCNLERWYLDVVIISQGRL